MKHFLLKRRRKLTTVLFSTVLLGSILATPLHMEAATQVKDKSRLSYGVNYKKLTYSKVGVDVMEVDVSDMFTEVQFGKAEPMNNVSTVKYRANSYHKKNNKILGAINANFFLVEKGKDNRPVHLISEDNRLLYAGFINTDKNNFVNQPIAFGMDKSGKGLIDHYNLDLTYTYKGTNGAITHTNRERVGNNMNLYTNDFYNEQTNTNSKGTEIVLKGANNPELTLGSTLNLTIDSIRKVGDERPTAIGDNSLVLSGSGTSSKKLEKMKVGETISINVGMDEKWQGSEFMIAGGPQLVKSGKVDISMNTNNWIGKTQTSRTAVGVDSKRNKVFFVTADRSLNDGMSIPELAKLMKDLGADTALNLDGGGSTTMVIRPNGNGALKVVNKLQDGFERGVSGILMAADTEPKRVFKDVSYRESLAESIHWAKETGAITGYEDNTFRPYNKLTRAHGAVMFARALHLELAEPNSVKKWFTDVKTTHPDYYAAEIATVAEAKIFKGKDNLFWPNNTMTREQMATTIAKAFGLKGNETNKVNISMKGVDPSHQEYVQILADNHVTTELNDFRPHEPVTRGQFAAFLHRASEIK